MPSKLGNYILLRTLGSGANSKVKLAQSTLPGNDSYYAIKVMKKANTEEDKRILALVETEV
jgi:serine/threonine protein kinase